MKHTDLFMKIPVRVYRTELEDYDEIDEFGVGWARIHYTDLMLPTWYEAYGKETIGVGEKTSFNMTIVRCNGLSYLCTWSIREFERELNKFMEKIDEILPQDSTNEEEPQE